MPPDDPHHRFAETATARIIAQAQHDLATSEFRRRQTAFGWHWQCITIRRRKPAGSKNRPPENLLQKRAASNTTPCAGVTATMRHRIPVGLARRPD